MSRYIVRIVGPSGMERYLYRGREVERDNATHYSSPSAAWNAANVYLKRMKLGSVTVDIVDERDPERQL